MITQADMEMNNLIDEIMDNGYNDSDPRPKYADDTPAYTKFVTHTVRSYDLNAREHSIELPILQLRPIAWKTGIREIFAIYQKPTNKISELREMGVTWWDEWDIGDGTIGKRYGGTVKPRKLMEKLLDDIIQNPYGRRHILDLYQYDDIETPGLHPCAFLTIWSVRGVYLDMILIQRSGDMLMASGPGGINETQYIAFQMMVARHCGYIPGKFTHVVANEHIYNRHFEQAREIQNRFKRLSTEMDIDSEPVRLYLNPNKQDFYSFTIDDFDIHDYFPIRPQLDLEIAI